MRIASLLPSFALLLLALPLAALGCNAKIATVLESDEAGSGPGPGGDPSSDAGTTTVIDSGVGPVPTPTPTTPTSPVCSNDSGCNDDPSVSSLWGTCFGGLCICNGGYTVQPNGKCGKLPAPDCQTQAAGKCHQQPATCADGMFESTNETNASCGDLIAAVCCFPETACKGPSVEVAGGGRTPIEMFCCAPTGGSRSPICVNGWQTCQPGLSAADKQSGCI